MRGFVDLSTAASTCKPFVLTAIVMGLRGLDLRGEIPQLLHDGGPDPDRVVDALAKATQPALASEIKSKKTFAAARHSDEAFHGPIGDLRAPRSAHAIG